MAEISSLLKGLESCTIVDLSNDVGQHADGPFRTEMDVLEPEPGTRFFCENVLPKLAPHTVGRFRPEDFPDGAFLRHEMVRASTHAGSHIDAPGHYGPSRDSSDRFINDAELGSFIAAGVSYDLTAVPGREIHLEHLRIPDRVATARGNSQRCIALLHTGGDKAIGADVIEAFLDVGVNVIGTDGASFDGPFAPMIENYLETGDQSVLWPAHVLGRRRPYYQLERLNNLNALPPDGFLVFALPVRIEGATAAWTRAIALVP